MTQPRYVINHERAEWVVRTLIDAWRRKLPPFDHAEPVPARLPRTLIPGSVQHAVWLLVGLLYMRGRIDSAQAFLRLCKVYDEHPWMFDPQTFMLHGFRLMNLRARMHKILKENGLGFNVRETVRFWNFNLKKLARFWDSNPLLIFDKARNYEELCETFMNGKGDPSSPTGFMGLRHKMVSMFLYFLINAKLVKPLMHPGPVDTHNIRVMASTESLLALEMGPGTRYEFYEVSPVARELYLKYCATVDDVIDFSNALWYLSRDFCSVSQGNGSSTSGYRGRATEVFAKRLSWPMERVDRYYSTCGQCSVESVCRWSLPSARQYNNGFLEIRGERPRPHNEQILLLDVPRVLASRPPEPEERKLVLRDKFQVTLFD
ncbi:hypothetical protein KW796_01130 [Candidatus Parcubacteria bacterium]|nr:hypothetical protein [Candidatus Parcubacteria bacterium]